MRRWSPRPTSTGWRWCSPGYGTSGINPSEEEGMGISVLIVGGGGREHALAWKIAKSPLVSKVYAAPGNPGAAQHAECVPLATDDVPKLVDFAASQRIDLTVVGPEAPLVAGL